VVCYECSVPANYEQIRAENIARYGWDTAVLDLLGHLYSDRTHFIFELIQNAEDAGATGLSFTLLPDRLEVRHDGRPFTEADVRGLCGVAQSSKSGDLTQIGRFGIGFKSVYAYTRNPRVYSGAERFRIESFVRPFALDPALDPAADPAAGPDDPAAEAGLTRFVFPFDSGSVPAPTAVTEIAAALNRLEPATLLFLRHLSRLRVAGTGVTEARLVRSTEPGPAGSQRISVSKDLPISKATWLAWSRSLPGHRGPGATTLAVEIAFPADSGPTPWISPLDRSPLSVFFPTEKETFLGFVVQGPYRTTPARDNVPEHDPANQDFVRQTAALLAEVLPRLRDAGLLTVTALTALPLDPARFPPGSMFRPLFDVARATLESEPLIPAADGEPHPAGDLALAADPGLAGLLSPDQLGTLLDAGSPLFFADPAISPEATPVLWRYLRDELARPELTAAALVTGAGAGFLAAQPDAWLARYYAFLHTDTRLWRPPASPDEPPAPARSQPIIRLEDGRQVPPFDAAGKPVVYLPDPLAPSTTLAPGPSDSPATPGASDSPTAPATLGTPFTPATPGTPDSPAASETTSLTPVTKTTTTSGASGLATVRRAVAADPAARRFLLALGLAEPDRVAAVLDGVLPRYDGLDLDALDPGQHHADLEYVAVTLEEAGPADRDRLLERLQDTTFLVGENAATGEPRLLPPSRLYQRSKPLELYFDGNPGVWFARDTYGPWLVQLRALGVRQDVQLTAREAGPSGHVTLVTDFGRNERGLDGFDPAAELDGLEFALAHPGHALAEYVWNRLLSPHRQLISGVVERSVLMSFADAARDTVTSAIGQAAEAAAWLPHPDGTFRRPAEVSLDDLPPTFARDEGLAGALGMPQPVVSLAARRLGVPTDVLWGLAAHPDLVELIERELRARDGQ
jgi:hypothetical protein